MPASAPEPSSPELPAHPAPERFIPSCSLLTTMLAERSEFVPLHGPRGASIGRASTSGEEEE